ncbi:MAG: hypothetical protein LAT57_00050 [Balneolales bacterium]|nr:hypothetical protein [Balneolales bacterium]
MTLPIPTDSFSKFKEYIFPLVFIGLFSWLLNAQLKTNELMHSLNTEIALLRQSQSTLSAEINTIRQLHELDKRISDMEYRSR